MATATDITTTTSTTTTTHTTTSRRKLSPRIASPSSPSFASSPRQSYDSPSPPVTPTTQIAGRSRVKGIKAPRNRPSVRDAFESSEDTTQLSRNRSNSNGLSWSPNHARNSLVDNMLLSLDNFGTIQDQSSSSPIGAFGSSSRLPDNDSFGLTSRSRGQTGSSVSSSESSDTYSSPEPKPRHRSNSSANFQSSLGRIDSIRITGQNEEDSKLGSSGAELRNKATGRDSGSSSLEIERPTRKFHKHRRSQSFDYGYIRMETKMDQQDLFSREQAADSATRPGASTTLRPATVNAAKMADVSHKTKETATRNHPAPEGLPPTKISTSQVWPQATSKENQKPGFFRKMFGSSKQDSPKAGHGKSVTTIQTRSPLSALEHATEQQQLQLLQKAPTKERQVKDPPPLNKKASFFRRRRKSLQDSPVPQLPDMYRDKEELPEPTTPDSPGSLQKVMDQYYESHRRMESKGSIAASRRKNSQGGIYPTIRAVGGPGAAASISRSPQAQSARNSIDKDMKSPSSMNLQEHKRSPSAGSKQDSREITTSFTIERSRPSGTHNRTQSDVDKDLPRLPVDYTAVKSETPKDIPTSKYNHATKASSQDTPTSTPQTVSTTATPIKTALNENARSTPSPRLQISSPIAQPVASGLRSKEPPAQNMHDDDDDLADETREAMLFSVEDFDGPSQEQKASARKLFDGTSGIDRAEIAPWLGDADPNRAKVREAYMALFDWKDLSILGALRSFCNHIQLKGETQQVDRLLDSLSRRWTECNPRHGFKATDVVHTICYSILLLNTDLHMADIESKMTRNQFIKNTIPTVRRVVADAAPHAFDGARSSMPPPARRQTEPPISSGLSIEQSNGDSELRPVHRLQSRPSDHSTQEHSDYDDCGPLVKSPYYGKASGWEAQVEVVLKNFYISIRNQRLPLSNGEEERQYQPQQSSLSLSATTGGMLRRTNSMLSKAGSETMPSRGRILDSRLGSRWSTKGRSRPRLYPASLAHSKTSFDDDQSAISPSMSSMWSRHSLGRGSMSVMSLASGYPNAEYQRSIGFANALSQAIIRSEPADESTEEFLREGPLLEDESLELAGAPWAKEGILKHKHHLESVDKKAKDRNWNECFAVIEKGWIRLFQFNMNSKSTRQRSKHMMGGGVVGGGNWMETAQSLGQFLLRHTIASALPPPGYSKTRPHVWALSLPTGAVHLFQVGTPDIVKEFVSTANYWSARLSKEPLTGGVSNIEYGWSDKVINMALVTDSRPPSAVPGHRSSISTSIRTSFDQSSGRPKLPGDKMSISEWTPPTQSMMASQLLEVDQLRALQTYVSNIEEELRKHNELRSPMLLAFTPKLSNHIKAMNNWERKSSYLLREIVKFSTYLESLQFAQKEMVRVRDEQKAREDTRSKDRFISQEHGLVVPTPATGVDDSKKDAKADK